MTTPNWYSPPTAGPGAPAPQGSPATAAVHPEYAGFGVRAGAQIIDMIVGFVVGGAAAFLSALVLVTLEASDVIEHGWAERMEATTLGGFAVGVLSTVSSHTAAEWVGGATLGKLALGLRVRSTDMAPCTFWGAFVRNLAFFFDGFFFALVAYTAMSRSPTRQRHGDRWGKTVVVKAASIPAPPSARRVALGIVAALVLSFAMTFADTVIRGL